MLEQSAGCFGSLSSFSAVTLNTYVKSSNMSTTSFNFCLARLLFLELPSCDNWSRIFAGPTNSIRVLKELVALITTRETHRLATPLLVYQLNGEGRVVTPMCYE